MNCSHIETSKHVVLFHLGCLFSREQTLIIPVANAIVCTKRVFANIDIAVTHMVRRPLACLDAAHDKSAPVLLSLQRHHVLRLPVRVRERIEVLHDG